MITFFQSFTHIIHYPFIKSNITIKHYQFCVTHTVASQRNDIHFIHTTIQIPNYPISPFHSFHSTFTFIYLNPLLLSFVLITIISVISVFCTNQTGYSFILINHFHLFHIQTLKLGAVNHLLIWLEIVKSAFHSCHFAV